MHFHEMIVRNTTQRPIRSLLTVGAIAVAIGSLISLVGVANGFERSFFEVYDAAQIDLIVHEKRSSLQQINGGVDEKFGPMLASIPGVRSVLGSLGSMEKVDDGGPMVVLLGWKPASDNFKNIRLLRGRTLTDDDKRCILAGKLFAEQMGVDLGGKIIFSPSRTFTIVGIFEANNHFQSGLLIIPLAELQTDSHKPDQVTDFSLILDKPGDADLIRSVQAAAVALSPEGDLSASTIGEKVAGIQEIRLAKGMSWMTSAIALLIGLFGITNTAVMSVHERTKELGILRAVGWRTSRIVRMIVSESILLSVCGAAVGTVGAFVLVRVMTRLPVVGGLIEGRIDGPLVVLGFALAVVLGMVGSVLPAWRVARMTPVEAIRHE